MSDLSKIKFTIGVCTYNNSSLLLPLFETLSRQTLNPRLFEIIVIDNNSTDNTREVVTDLIMANPSLSIRYVLETKQGLSHARNRAWQEAKGDYLVYIDDDTLVYSDWLEGYYHVTEEFPEPVILGGRVLIKTVTPRPKWFSDYIENWFGKYDFGDRVREITLEAIRRREFFFPIGCNFVAKVSFLKEIGGFDPNLGRNKKQMLGGEETKVSMTALEKGYKIFYSPFSTLEHVISSERLSTSFLKNKFFMQGKSTMIISQERARKPWIRFMAGKALYMSTLIPGLFSLSHSKRFETKLKLLFEMGVISGYIEQQGSCRRVLSPVAGEG